ncbi:hypothetical protein KKE26_00675, partial [bacterium]|nr:hypothetical protein [bacterium]
MSTVNCRIVNYVWTEPAPANAVGDRGADSPVSAADNKRPQEESLSDRDVPANCYDLCGCCIKPQKHNNSTQIQRK